MLRRLALLVVTAAVCAWPAAAEACSCADEGGDLVTRMRTARTRAGAIYRARVESLSQFGAVARASVREVFKGDFGAGAELALPSGGGGDCTILFRAGVEYLAYADRTPTDVHMCSRTREITSDDPELVWLRTGRLPPAPVAMQREVVSCSKPCTIDDVVTRLTGLPPKPRSLWGADADLEADLKAGRPFFAFARTALGFRLDVGAGISTRGKPFELTQVRAGSGGRCTRKIELRWCKAMRLAGSPAAGAPWFECVEPGVLTVACDETASRVAAWNAPESLPRESCNWFHPTQIHCDLKSTATPLPERAPQSPLLVCRPDADLEGPSGGVYLCGIEEKPMPYPKR